MNVNFSATQSLELRVPTQPIPIQHYLRQPQRLIYSLAEPSRIERLSADTFRLKMRSLKFITFNLQPIVDLQLWSGSDGSVELQSVGCELRGVEAFNQRFHLQLYGKLMPMVVGDRNTLQGTAELTVQLDLPPALSLTPRAIVNKAGDTLLSSVLLNIKQRLMHQLLLDYQAWVAEEIRPPAGRGQLETSAK
jgi:hypothetical protein